MDIKTNEDAKLKRTHLENICSLNLSIPYSSLHFTGLRHLAKLLSGLVSLLCKEGKTSPTKFVYLSIPTVKQLL